MEYGSIGDSVPQLLGVLTIIGITILLSVNLLLFVSPIGLVVLYLVIRWGLIFVIPPPCNVGDCDCDCWYGDAVAEEDIGTSVL